MKGELTLPIVKRAYRHLQNHPYFLISMLSFYLLYFILVFAVVLLIKQFSDSSIQLTTIVNSLQSQQLSLDVQTFQLLESITKNYLVKYQSIFLAIASVGTISLVLIQLFVSKIRHKEYNTYLLMGERVYKLTAQLIIEHLILTNSVVLFLFVLYSFFAPPIVQQASQFEAETLQMEVKANPPDSTSQKDSSLSESKNENFTRFNVKPFLKGDSINNKFGENNTLQAVFLVVFINLYSCMVIGIPTYIVLSLTKGKLS